MGFTEIKVEKYSESFTTPEPEIITRLIKATKENLQYTDMLSGRQVGMLLRMLVSLLKPKRVLEIGTFTGYSAIMMAGVMDKGTELTTIEINRHYQLISKPFFSEPPYNEIIVQIIGNALEVIPSLKGKFDLIYLDCDKINYPNYYRLLKQKISFGGVLVTDNVLWGGDVPDQKNEKAEAIHQFNLMVHEDKDCEQVMLSVRDGISIARFSNTSG